MTTSRSLVRIHLTNVVGAGASQLLSSLLPALESTPWAIVESIQLPDRGELTGYRSTNILTKVETYSRVLPNSLSRFLECTFLAGRFDGRSPLLVLGDLPLRCWAPQTVFLQQSNLLKSEVVGWGLGQLKYVLARAIFKWNLSRVRAFIVQTGVMREELERRYPELVGRVHVVAQPVPTWLLDSGLKRKHRVRSNRKLLELIYPAVGYPHKNHALLSRIEHATEFPVERLVLTLDPSQHPAPKLSWVQCVGFLTSQAMLKAYSEVDALLFLSTTESYGFPLVEAMFVGLPIVCPDLPYARTICGNQAIYFEQGQPESLQQALQLLHQRLEAGWWPDWRDSLARIPENWGVVAHEMLKIACNV